MITDLSTTNSTVYNTFWKNFGKYVKVGIIEDEKNRNDLVPLCRFYSSYTTNTTSSTTSTTANELTSLPEYVARMTADQKFIYYVVGKILYYYYTCYFDYVNIIMRIILLILPIVIYL